MLRIMDNGGDPHADKEYPVRINLRRKRKMEKKKWYHSKTLWANTIALGGTVLNQMYGIELTPEEVAGVFAVLNFVLRIVTKQPIG